MKNTNTKMIDPVITYNDASEDMKSLLKDNKGKSGIYLWTNKITDKTYDGSSVNLGRRFSTYFSYNYLAYNNLPISRALLKYGYSEFRLDILEFCDKSVLIEREQYYLDLLKPEYNILKEAGSLLGFVHSESTRKRLANINIGRKISEEVRAKMSRSQKGRVFSLEAIEKMRVSKLGRKHSEEHKAKLREAALGKNNVRIPS